MTVRRQLQSSRGEQEINDAEIQIHIWIYEYIRSKSEFPETANYLAFFAKKLAVNIYTIWRKVNARMLTKYGEKNFYKIWSGNQTIEVFFNALYLHIRNDTDAW